MEMTMDVEALFALPTGHRPDAAVEIGSNLLPGIQPIVGHPTSRIGMTT
jgi:hypothetical protein